MARAPGRRLTHAPLVAGPLARYLRVGAALAFAVPGCLTVLSAAAVASPWHGRLALNSPPATSPAAAAIRWCCSSTACPGAPRTSSATA